MNRHDATLLDPVRYVRFCWPAVPRSLSSVRSTVREWLSPLNLADTAVQDITLAVSEAVTNSVTHAYVDQQTGPVELTLLSEGSTVFVAVVDRGRWREPGHSDGDELDCGRGVMLMHRLSDTTTIDRGPSGTRVTMNFSVVARPSAGDLDGSQSIPDQRSVVEALRSA